jgi:hypothetical protein
MSRAGEVWDNSAMESLYSTLKIERVNRRGLYKTRQAAKADVFDYISAFTILSVDARRLDMSVLCNLNHCSMLKSVSTGSDITHTVLTNPLISLSPNLS